MEKCHAIMGGQLRKHYGPSGDMGSGEMYRGVFTVVSVGRKR